MNRGTMIGVIVGMLLSLTAVAEAQDTGTGAGPTTVPGPATQVAPGCAVEGDPLGAVCAEVTVANATGSFVGGAFYIQAADRGWIRLTECDDLIVPCDLVYVRAEGVAQGDGLAIGPLGGE